MPNHPAPRDADPNGHSLRRALWPIALFSLVLVLLFVATQVSAWGRGESHDVGHFKSHAERIVNRALDRIDASDEQSTAIQAIVAAGIDDLHAARGEAGSMREEFHALLTAESVDRAAIEALRAEHIERADRVSRILAERVVEVMEVLTPEQRAELEAHLAEHRGGHRRHGWGWH